MREGEGTLTIRREISTEVRQAGRENRTRRQTGQDEILATIFLPTHNGLMTSPASR